MIVYLIRHGCSIANEQKLVTGTPKDGLSDLGRRQAVALNDWLLEQKVQPERFFISQWARARETATCIFPKIKWEMDYRLGETDAGSVADMPLSDFMEVAPFFYKNPGNKYPGGESHLDLNLRVLNWLNEQLEKPCGSIVVVAHSGPISCILQNILQIDMASFPAFLPAHASVSVISFSRLNDVWKGKLNGFSLGAAETTRRVLHGNF